MVTHGNDIIMKTVLTIAGSDTCAGAGIQQDLKTISALNHYAVTVTTALTAQNTRGVQKIMRVPDDMLCAQLESVLSDIRIDAAKTGMIPDEDSARIIVSFLKNLRVPIVCDPVMISTSGTQLMSDCCIDYIKSELFPLCTLVTPNIPEAKRLSESTNAEDIERVGHSLSCQHNTAFLLKGGHSKGSVMKDMLFTPDGSSYSFSSPRITTSNLHGTGCTLSSAIATFLAGGQPLPQAVECAKSFIDRAIFKGKELHIGKGNGPLWPF